MKKILVIIIALIFPYMVQAEEITNKCNITISNSSNEKITDNNYKTYVNKSKEDILTIECDNDIKNIYIIYHKETTKGKIITNSKKEDIGKNNYLHELIKIDGDKNVKLEYEDAYSIADIYIYGDDDLPEMVQDWETLDTADLMLFSTHSDDEHIFFAGLLPTYVNEGKKIQVVYFTKHFDNVYRYNELLNGLWAAGIKYYPVMSEFPDAWSTTKDGALKNLERKGFTLEDAIKFEVTQIRKYKPYVVVGHDEDGEYSHGQHILNTYVLKEAYKLASDESYKADNLKPWQIQKLYLHLYKENPIELNLDTPLDTFNGKTAYEVSKNAYTYHLSQQYTWFTDWINGKNKEFTKATQIKKYSPCKYGLYYSNVGSDINKNNMFENVKETKTIIKEEEKKQSKDITIKDLQKKSNIPFFVITSIVIILLIILIIKVIKIAKWK